MGRKRPYGDLLGLPQEDLERKVALLYEQGLLDLQERMHPGSTRRVAVPGIVIHGADSAPPKPGAGESPAELAAHGRAVFRAMLDPVQPLICEDFRNEPGLFERADRAVPRILRHLTRVAPPDELFVAAACLLWRTGISEFCGREETMR